MPPSEIDEIFAGKTSETGKTGKKKKETKSKQQRNYKIAYSETATATAHVEASISKRPAPETVLDPSHATKKVKLEASKKVKTSKASKTTQSTKQDTSSRSTVRARIEEDELFVDSRGTKPRRKTEDGYLIYTEEELGINNEGGDTPLCPFDCQCCF